jgi:outer membrane lipoprotein carrier protein
MALNTTEGFGMVRSWLSLLVFGTMTVWSQIVIPTSFSATFVQKVTTPKHKVIRYSGDVRVNRTREFLWRYRQPSRREICGDGQRVRIVDHRLKQVVIYRVGSLLDLMQLLKRAKPYKGSIYLTRYHGVRYTIKLDPKGRIEQVAYKDEMDNVVNIHFYRVRYADRPIPPAQLRCKIPRTYDTVKG